MGGRCPQSSTDTMVALQKKQSLLFIRCCQCRLCNGRACQWPVQPRPHPPVPGPCHRTCGHRAGTRQRWGERSRWGRGLPHWWAAGSRVQGGLSQIPRQVGVRDTVVLTCTELLWPHSAGRQLPPAQMQRLGVCQHLFHLGQLLHADVICICGGGGVGGGVRPNVASEPSAS